MNITQPRRTRRTHTEAFKRSLIEACGEAGARALRAAPGEQMQIDLGQARVMIGGEPVRAFLFVATLGYRLRDKRHSGLLQKAAAATPDHG